ncbi:hypothetical protein FRC02_002321 [Tulasnella sp. 418]|nr:hypothetical protein FRC02_002321 [Tulasnella sp. 418]
MRLAYIRHFVSSIRNFNVRSPIIRNATDELGLPIKPTWSVQSLLSSYPPPTLDGAILTKLHGLAALSPPPHESPEFEKLRGDLVELIRLVEAVKTAELGEPKSSDEGIPDGRIWQKDRCMTFEEDVVVAGTLGIEPGGQELMEHAKQQTNGFYTVPSSRPSR